MTAINNPQKTLTLAEAVITQAWQDAMVAANLEARAMDAIEDAWAFLTEPAGPWAQARDFWCCMAGRDESRLRAQAVAATEQHRAVIEAFNVYRKNRLARARQRYGEQRRAA